MQKVLKGKGLVCGGVNRGQEVEEVVMVLVEVITRRVVVVEAMVVVLEEITTEVVMAISAVQASVGDRQQIPEVTKSVTSVVGMGT